MHIRIKLQGNKIENWDYGTEKQFEFWVYDIWDSKLKAKLEKILAERTGEDDAIAKIKELAEQWNYPFAVVLKSQHHCLVFADHIQSYNLFFYVSGDTISISDTPSLIVDEQAVLKKPNIQGFMFTRFTLGSRTMINNLYQVPAGQYLHIKQDSWELKNHYIYQNKYPEHFNPEIKKAELRETLLEVFTDFLDLANGRQLILMFSGGYDSRLILWALDQLEAPNVLLCSYGRRWQRDVMWARKFAQYVPYKWKFIPRGYFNKRRFYQSGEKEKYYKSVHQFCRKPFTMDIHAINKLQQEGLLEENAIFINGMSGGFISGGHLNKKLKKPLSYQDCANIIIRKYFNLWNWKKADDNVRETIKTQIVNDLQHAPIEENLSDSLFEWWVWREKQSKLMVSSSDEFNWYGYRLAMPLWDKRLVKFFNTIPFTQRLDQKLFRSFITELKTRSGQRFDEVPHTIRSGAGYLLKIRRFAEFMAHPNWANYRLQQIKIARNIASNLLGTQKLDSRPKILGYSNALLIDGLLKKYEMED